LPVSPLPHSPAFSFLDFPGEMASLIKSFDWASTALGPVDQWPQSLKTTTGFLLRSPVPIVLLWGLDGVMIYNDAYSSFAGGRHPRLLGSKVREGWPEVADFNDNVMKVVMAGGTLSYRDQNLTLYRRREAEPCLAQSRLLPGAERGQSAGGGHCNCCRDDGTGDG
jgi:hypothetical protein